MNSYCVRGNFQTQPDTLQSISILGNTVYGYDTHHFRASYGLAYPALAFHRQFSNWTPVYFTNL